MPRRKREESVLGMYHFITRGVNKKVLFHEHADFMKYRDLVLEIKQTTGIRIHHYCFMTNHTHMLVFAPDMAALSRYGYDVSRRYALYYARKYRWAGQVFQRCFRSFPIQLEAEFLECGRYIERNPLNAKLAKRVQDYPYTSFRNYALGLKDPLVTDSLAFQDLSPSLDQRRSLYADYVCAFRLEKPQDLLE